MPKLPQVSGKEAIRVFEKCGFRIVRTKGSHHVMKKDGFQTRLSIAVHGNKSLPKGTLDSLIEDSGLSLEEFISYL